MAFYPMIGDQVVSSDTVLKPLTIEMNGPRGCDIAHINLNWTWKATEVSRLYLTLQNVWPQKLYYTPIVKVSLLIKLLMLFEQQWTVMTIMRFSDSPNIRIKLLVSLCCFSP